MQLPFVAGQETRIVRKQKPKKTGYLRGSRKKLSKKKKTLNYTGCFWNERRDATLKGCLGKEWRGVTRRKKEMLRGLEISRKFQSLRNERKKSGKLN